MDKSYNCLNNLKCFKCSHSSLCMQRLGGADLAATAATCEHFSAGTLLPENFWLLVNPEIGRPILQKYSVDKALFENGCLSKLWGSSEASRAVAYAWDFDKTVFFSEVEATAALQALLEAENLLEEVCPYWSLEAFAESARCRATRDHGWCSCRGSQSRCTYYTTLQEANKRE